MDKFYVWLIALFSAAVIIGIYYVVKTFFKSVDDEMEQHKEDYRNLTP